MLRSGSAPAFEEPVEDTVPQERERHADSTMLEPLMGRYGDEVDFVLPDCRAGFPNGDRVNSGGKFDLERFAHTNAFRPIDQMQSFGLRKSKKVKKGKGPTNGRR